MTRLVAATLHYGHTTIKCMPPIVRSSWHAIWLAVSQSSLCGFLLSDFGLGLIVLQFHNLVLFCNRDDDHLIVIIWQISLLNVWYNLHDGSIVNVFCIFVCCYWASSSRRGNFFSLYLIITSWSLVGFYTNDPPSFLLSYIMWYIAPNVLSNTTYAIQCSFNRKDWIPDILFYLSCSILHWYVM